MIARLLVAQACVSSRLGMGYGAKQMGACVDPRKPAMLGARRMDLPHPMDRDMNTDHQLQFFGSDAPLNMLLERIGGALTVSRQVTLPSGKLDAVIVATTLEAAELFGFSQSRELIGKLLSEVHDRRCIQQTRLYSCARILGDPDAPNAYPARIRRDDGQLVWVHKEVEHRIEPDGSIWITKNALLPQDRQYSMPKLRRLDDIVHECVTGNLVDLFTGQQRAPSVRKSDTLIPSHSEDSTTCNNVNNELLTEITNVSEPTAAPLPFEQSHTVALPLRHADRPIWIHECKVDGCGRQWWSYTERPQHCPRCGSRLWQGSSKWERRRVFKRSQEAPHADANPDENA